jgi:peptidoglycan/xylan/chitin deacetylase (PgdA/CDA1 family)
VSILCYHAIDPSWESPLSVHPDAFARQVDWICRRRNVVDVRAALGRVDRQGRLPPRMSAVTFDDGFVSVFDHAWPAARRAHLPITVFLVAETLVPGGRDVDWVDDPPPWPLPTMTISQILELRDGAVTIGSHSWAHRNLTELGDAECERDLRESRELLEDLVERPIDLLAYPRGLNDVRVRRAAVRAGYRAGFTLPERREPVDAMGIPRVGIYRGNGLAHLAVKSAREYLSLRNSDASRSVREALSGWRSRAAGSR